MNWNRCLRLLARLSLGLAGAISLWGQIPSQGLVLISCPAQAAAGSTAWCSVGLSLANGVTVDGLSFKVRVAPAGLAPALTSGALSFSDSIGGGSADTGGTPNEIAATWAGISPALTGITTLGYLGFLVPPTASTGHSYWALFTASSASMGGNSVPVSGGSPASISVPAPAPLVVTGPSFLLNGVAGYPYAGSTFTASGGTSGYSWSATGLPAGLTFTSDGQLSGTPTQSGSFNPKFTVTDSNSNTASTSLSLVVIPSNPSCSYTLSPGSGGFPQAGGSGSISVTVASGCSWTAVPAGSINWISLTGSSGTGSGTVTYQVSANNGNARAGTLMIGGATFTVYQTGSALVPVGSLPHIAAGGSWQSSITIANLWPVSEQIRLNIFDDNGNPLALPLVFPQTSSTPQTVSSVDRTLSPGSELIIQTSNASAPSFTAGWVQLLSDGKAEGSTIFGSVASGSLQEAVALNEARNPSAFLLSFDNTGNLATGIAVANVSNQSVVIPVVLRDSAGTQLGTGSIPLAAHGHTQFMLGDTYPVTKGQVGTAELTVPYGGQISALGIRATGGAITSVPVLAR